MRRQIANFNAGYAGGPLCFDEVEVDAIVAALTDVADHAVHGLGDELDRIGEGRGIVGTRRSGGCERSEQDESRSGQAHGGSHAWSSGARPDQNT